jgi:hypothetical protein
MADRREQFLIFAEKWEVFFSPEVRKSGEILFEKDLIVKQLLSDTQINVAIRATPPIRVHFNCESINSREFIATCTCGVFQKNRLCRHIWATLVYVNAVYPDFLDFKFAIERGSILVDEFKENIKKQQSIYRKKIYQQLKDTKKQLNPNKKKRASSRKPVHSLGPNVKAALEYFKANGFLFELPFSEVEIANAKRTLSRVFHPDKGGTHGEIVELLKHVQTLMDEL